MPFVKRVVRKAFRRLGLHIQRQAPDSLKEHLGSFMSLHNINCVIDVGAHYGEYAQLLRNIGFQGRIVSFEPAAEAYRMLLTTAHKDRNWITHNLALGSEPGEKIINIHVNSVFNSFLHQTNFCNKRFPNETDVIGQEKVLIETLDNMYASCVDGMTEPKVFLKLDTQGYDLEVIKGAQQVMPEIIGLQSEISAQPLYAGMPNMIEALSAYSSMGFVVTGLYPVTRNHDLSVIEFDCVLYKTSTRSTWSV